MSLPLSPAAPAEYPAIVEMINAAYRGTGSVPGWTESSFIEGARTTLPLLQNELATHPRAVLLTAHSENQALLGCVWLEPKTDVSWYLGSLAVDPSLQKAGIGRQILTAAEEWARQRGAQEIRMEVVNIRETLIAWYLRRGYRLNGETKPFPYGANRFGKPLRADLCFVVLEKSLV